MYHDLAAVVVAVRATQGRHLNKHLGRALQQVMLREVVEPHDPDLSQRLHEGNGPKPYTVSGLMTDGERVPLYGDVAVGDKAWFRLVGLQREVVAALRGWALDPPEIIEIDRVPWAVEAVHQRRSLHPAADNVRYQSLVETWGGAEPDRKLPLAVTVPASFRSGGMNTPFPLPSLVFGSLRRQWADFSGIPLPDELDAFIEHFVMLAQYELRTDILTFKQRSRSVGFTGSLVYEIGRRNQRIERVEPELNERLQAEHRRLAQMVHMLTAFGTYSGIGVKTSAGMGMMWRG